MSDENLNAPQSEQSIMPAETIATESATRIEQDAPQEPEPVETGDAPEGGADASADASDAKPGDAEKPEGEKPKLDWRERRRIEETNKRKAAEAENARLKAELEALRKGQSALPDAPQDASVPGMTPEQVRAAAIEEAKRQIDEEQRARAFSEATGRVLNAGLQAYPDFDAARGEMVANFGDQLAQRTDFFEALTDLPNGHDVFYALAKDPETTEAILALPPVKLALRLSQISAKAEAAKAPAPKPISKVPAPVKPVGGNPPSNFRFEDEGAPMDTWAKNYLKTVAGRGR